MRDEERRKLRRKRLLIVCSLLAAGIVLVVVLIVASPGKRLPKVPDVIGLTYKQAKNKVEAVGLVIDIHPLQNTSKIKDIERLKVETQSPSDGKTAEKGTLVTVTLEGVPNRQDSEGGEADNQQAQTSNTTSSGTVQPQSTQTTSPEQAPGPEASLAAPLDGEPLYPFTKDASISCGHWPSGSQDYPYFGAPRDGNTRKHAGIDIYPQAGEGAPVKAIKDGKVIKVAPFYTRYTGEVTYGVLIDHGDFAANYAELQPPEVKVGDAVKQGQSIGHISGTKQLHFELYSPGTSEWTKGWYGSRPANLMDPTEMMLGL